MPESRNFPSIQKRKLSVKVITDTRDNIQSAVNDWLNDKQEEDTIVGEPTWRIAPDGTVVVIYHYVTG